MRMRDMLGRPKLHDLQTVRATLERNVCQSAFHALRNLVNNETYLRACNQREEDSALREP